MLKYGASYIRDHASKGEHFVKPFDFLLFFARLEENEETEATGLKVEIEPEM